MDEGFDSRKLEVNIGDEVRASLRVKGNQVKETTGIVSEISKNGYVRLRTCKVRRSKQRTGVVSVISKKGTVKLTELREMVGSN